MKDKSLDAEQHLDSEQASDADAVDQNSVDQTNDAADAPADGSANGAVESEVNGSSDLDDELAKAQEEIAKLKDAFLRSKAEEDNVRRRAEKEVANARKFAVEGFAKEMLNVFDSLKLATTNEPADDADETVKSIYEGSKITLNQLGSAFAKFSLKEIAPDVGQKLDPNLHQAMSMVDAEGVESGHIVTVIQVGFELHDRLLRPAMVVVAK